MSNVYNRFLWFLQVSTGLYMFYNILLWFADLDGGNRTWEFDPWVKFRVDSDVQLENAHILYLDLTKRYENHRGHLLFLFEVCCLILS